MNTLLLRNAGVCSLASAALLGWPIALHRSDPAAIKALGVKAPHRIMQLHLDQVMMGLIMLSVSTAFPRLPERVGAPLLVGTILNPLGFLPLVFFPTCDKTLLFKGFIGFSFISSTVGFVGLAHWALTQS